MTSILKETMCLLLMGDNTPATPDNTDFGSTCILGTIVKTFTFENTGVGSLTLNSGAITVTGTDNAMFTIGGITLPASIAAGSSTTFMVTYSPHLRVLKQQQSILPAMIATNLIMILRYRVIQLQLIT